MSNKVLEVFVFTSVFTHHLVPCDLSLHELVGSQQEVDTPSVLTQWRSSASSLGKHSKTVRHTSLEYEGETPVKIDQLTSCCLCTLPRKWLSLRQ